MKAFVQVLKGLTMATAREKNALTVMPGEVYQIVRQNKVKHMIRLRRIKPRQSRLLPDFDMTTDCLEEMLSQEVVDITTKT